MLACCPLLLLTCALLMTSSHSKAAAKQADSNARSSTGRSSTGASAEETRTCIEESLLRIEQRWPAQYLEDYCKTVKDQILNIAVNAEDAAILKAALDELLDWFPAWIACEKLYKRALGRKEKKQAQLAARKARAASAAKAVEVRARVEPLYSIEVSKYVKQWMNSDADPRYQRRLASLLIRLAHGDRTYMLAKRLTTMSKSCDTPIFETRLTMSQGGTRVLWQERQGVDQKKKAILVWRIVHHDKVNKAMKDIEREAASKSICCFPPRICSQNTDGIGAPTPISVLPGAAACDLLCMLTCAMY